MKKIFTRIISVALLICCVFGLGACDRKIASVAISTENVTSNGGPVAKQGNDLYFVNGFVAATATSNNYGKVTTSSLYKATLKDDGTFALDEEGNVQNVKQLVSSQVGFAKGSIYVYGEYVYYATPYSGKNRKGETLYNYLSFYRIKNDGTERTLICNTDTIDQNVIYSYYVTGESSLALVLFEKDSKILSSYLVSDKVEKVVIDVDVVSCVLSETNGEGGKANDYIIYTKSVENTDESQIGNKVFKVKPDGTDNALISTGRNIDIVTICNGYLVYVCEQQTKISDLSNNLSKSDKTISYVKYNLAIYVPSTNGVSMIVYDTTNEIKKVRFVNGENQTSYVLYEDAVTFIGFSGDYVYFYNSSNLIFKVKFTEAKNDTTNKPIQLTDKAVSAQTGNMVCEVVDGYVYFFAVLTNEDKSTRTMLYRTSCANTASQAAELVGV